eukprot:GHUV01052433.1.p2 GENE.GHUV01052433.1~~GHUV01052433.1.p2  ORF type:complete len:127 (-),score=36.50 GHUV01052433.1:112-492(-)
MHSVLLVRLVLLWIGGCIQSTCWYVRHAAPPRLFSQALSVLVPRYSSAMLAHVQVQEWKLKCEAIEKREAERRESEMKKHKEEVAYLENYAKQLKGQLEAYVTPAKKGAGPGSAAAAGGQPVMQAA